VCWAGAIYCILLGSKLYYVERFDICLVYCCTCPSAYIVETLELLLHVVGMKNCIAWQSCYYVLMCSLSSCAASCTRENAALTVLLGACLNMVLFYYSVYVCWFVVSSVICN
jgi:hypothetical protein